ncbi:hypothetical protein FXO38_09427 [Capsicum annuum]|uniref:homeobox-leucine zipper protein ROC8 n=1 Tax=Capsicum annuum TaxID=4072 RepID=UPI0007BF69B4|nr:homeobox-leucine zipper protein ROC8 [Capsicum annuum]XP_047257551.1 homeobox-leucine zipper protein ROC8 [Capsicum annuum]KAF3665724.1 hypothetical protein FXO38_09427 [Capsicum annuum]
MMKVAQRMASSFCVSTSLSNGQQWNNISTLDEFEVRATLQKCTDSGHPNGVVISAASPIPPLHVFNFLRDERTRSQRGVLFNQNSIQEVAHIANDTHPGNSISVLRAWFRELPSGVLDSLSPRQVMQCLSEEDCSTLVRLLPPTEVALPDWAINIIVDVVLE